MLPGESSLDCWFWGRIRIELNNHGDGLLASDSLFVYQTWVRFGLVLFWHISLSLWYWRYKRCVGQPPTCLFENQTLAWLGLVTILWHWYRKTVLALPNHNLWYLRCRQCVGCLFENQTLARFGIIWHWHRITVSTLPNLWYRTLTYNNRWIV